MAAITRIEVMTPQRSGTELAALLPSAARFMEGIRFLAALLVGAFTSGARVRVSVDESTPKAATGTVTLTQASLTAGDVVYIGTPGGVAALVAVAGAATVSAGTWSKDTSSAAAGISLAAAINGFALTAKYVTATDNGSGVVTITARASGTSGNEIALRELDASGGIARSGNTLTGGLDAAPLTTVLGTFSGVGTANDTITIGGVVLTLVASAANESQITIGGTAAESATNTIAVINAHSKLKGFVVASSGGSAIVALQLQMAGRIGNIVGLTDAGTGFSWAATSMTPTQTETFSAASRTYQVGAPA